MLCAVLVLISGCDPVDRPPDREPVTPAHLRERSVAVPATAGTGSVVLAVEVLADEGAFLLRVRSEEPSALIGIVGITSPSGERVHAESGPLDDTVVDSRITNVSWSGEGEVALFLPNAPGIGPMPGTWHIEIAREDGVRLSGASLIAVRRSLDDPRRRLDMAVMDATVAGVWGQGWRVGRRARLDPALQRDAMDTVLDEHALGIGRIDTLSRAPRGLRGALSINGGDDADLCRAATREADPWALPVVIVDGFRGDGDEAEELVGWAPVPGVLRAPDSAASCVFVWSHADIGNGAERNAAFAMTLLHEAGHFMGLEHVTEADGLLFDRLDDTRECRADVADGRHDDVFDVAGEVDGLVDDFECGRADGANNLMFWSGVPEFAPFVLSEQQADVLRRHPLFGPVGQR